MYAIYQLNLDDTDISYRFQDMENLKERGITVRTGDYRQMYSGLIDSATTLDDIFEKFNLHRPDDFMTHSLSVSDIILIRRDGQEMAHYVDSFGFEELPDYVSHLRNPEQSIQEYEMQQKEKAKSTKEEIPFADKPAIKNAEENIQPVPVEEEVQNLQKQLQDKENIIRYLQSYKENNNTHLSEEALSDSSKHRKQKGFFSLFKKKAKDDSNLSLDHFIQEFIDSGDFSKAQVDFLVDCLDEVDQLEDMKQWAILSVEVNVMRCLRL